MEAIASERQALKNDQYNLQYYKDKMRQTSELAEMQCEDYRSRFLQQMNKLKYKEQQLQEYKLGYQQKLESQNKIIEEKIIEREEQAAIMELALQK